MSKTVLIIITLGLVVALGIIFTSGSKAKDDLVSAELHVWSGGGGHKIDELLDVIIIYSAKLERNISVTNILNPLNMQPEITFVGWNGVFSPLIRYSFTKVSLPGAK